jgi:hypothetical protein
MNKFWLRYGKYFCYGVSVLEVVLCIIQLCLGYITIGVYSFSLALSLFALGLAYDTISRLVETNDSFNESFRCYHNNALKDANRINDLERIIDKLRGENGFQAYRIEELKEKLKGYARTKGQA